MGFQGYKLRRKFTVFQTVPADNESPSICVRNFEMILYLSSNRTNFMRFDEIESAITTVVERYTNKPLEMLPPFDKLEPTLENTGIVFFHLIRDSLNFIDVPLEKLEISESHVKTYIVTDVSAGQCLIVDGKRVNISGLLMADIVSQSVSRLMSDFELNTRNPGHKAPKTDATVPAEEKTTAQPADPGHEHEESINIPAAGQQTAIEIHTSGSCQDTKLQIRFYTYRLILCFALLVICGAAISFYLYDTGAYPSGADIYGHLFKSDLLYNSIKNGDYYPLYTDLWYNGLQPFRYWAPLPYYLLAVLQFMVGGDALVSYLAFISFAFIVGGTGWLLWGIAYKRLMFCTFLGIMWFLLPDNIRVFFVEGNLPRMVVAIFLPYLFFFIWQFVEHRKKRAVVPVVMIMCMIILCHVMIAAMIGITTFILLLIYSISQKRASESFYMILFMLLSFALCGFWLYPALQGGLMSMDASATAEVMRALSTPASISLNPALRDRGLYELFYFGISILSVSVTGLFWADKKSRCGFLTVILVFLGTLPLVVPLLEKLPLNQLLWMTRFTPIVYTIFFFSMLEWKKCRRYVLIVIAFILILDSFPSLNLQRYHSRAPAIMSYTLQDAKAMANQRISLLDVSAFGSYPSFGISTEEPRRRYTYGWAWQGASTAHNIMMLNTALERGFYHYLFDRSIEMGDDTVLVHKEQVERAKMTLDALISAASASKYTLRKETNYAYIFKRDTPKSFGVATDYEGLAIGAAADLISFEFPIFEEGTSDNILDYSQEKLKKYKMIYLSAFTYNDKKAAEELLIEIADAGVKVIIDMNRIPADPVTNRMTFLGVTAQPVSFTNRYPELIYKGKIYDAMPFKETYQEWNTVYLDNLDSIFGYSWFQNKELPFIGTAGHSNILIIGYNFLFHSIETNDKIIIGLMGDLTGFEQNKLPERKIIPLTVQYAKDTIIIDSPGGEINTTIGFQDVFQSDQAFENRNNLLVIKEPHTKIKMAYPYPAQGMITGISGILGITVLAYAMSRKRGVKNEKTTN